MKYAQRITIDHKTATIIDRYLTIEPRNAAECLSEDETYTFTATFANGIEIDIKCCGVQYREDEDCNTAWCEAVMFDNGRECGNVIGEDTILGEWQFEYNGDDYTVAVATD